MYDERGAGNVLPKVTVPPVVTVKVNDQSCVESTDNVDESRFAWVVIDQDGPAS